ncbi:hypothetical protein BDR04DRAFT_1193484 [Suillus decipiens]|nr:hypothetical protein BDR04DRAFT_1193484 [Suillus decipiens]
MERKGNAGNAMAKRCRKASIYNTPFSFYIRLNYIIYPATYPTAVASDLNTTISIK